MVTDLDALEASLRNDPDDWDRWLAYAERLDGHDDERAQLIRWEHAVINGTLAEDELVRIADEATELRRARQPDWLEGVMYRWELGLTWRGGFVTEASIQAQGDDALEAALALLAHPSARLLHALDLGYAALGDARIDALARSGRLGTLTSLRLSRNDIGDAGATTLADALVEIRKLEIDDNDIGDAGVAALATGGLVHLKALDLRLNLVGTQGAIALARSTDLGSLTHLDLTQNEITDEGALALGEDDALPSLVELLVPDNVVGPPTRLVLQERRAARGCTVRA